MQKAISYYRELLERYLDNTISRAEAEELFNFIKQYPGDAREVLQASGDAGYGDRFIHLENIDASVSQRMFDRLQRSIPSSGQLAQRPLHRVRLLGAGWLRYAAAAVLLAGITAAFFVQQGHKETNALVKADKALQKDIAPGGNKATLTLADGSKIVLDDAHNGNLAQQGNTRIVKSNNDLAYEAQGSGPDGKIEFNMLSVPRGGQYALTLPDGTKVWLNAASSIKYPTSFAGKERIVDVTGEVYMDVAKNTRQPFIVRANGAEVRVLGTSFNINAYEDEDVVRTTLIEGSVAVARTSSAGTRMLVPGQQAEVTDSSEVIKVAMADTEHALAWKNGLFSFNNADIKTIMRQLSRWYDINIVYEKGVPSQRFFGEVSKSLTLSQVLKGLEVSKVNFRLEGRNLVVMP